MDGGHAVGISMRVIRVDDWSGEPMLISGLFLSDSEVYT